MKKTILAVVGLVLTFSVLAYATISLNSSVVETYQVGTTVVENNNVASVTNAGTNFPSQTITVTLQLGTGTNPFQASTHSKPLTIVINGQTGIVAVSDGRDNLKLTSAQQAALQAFLKSFQNNIETSLVNWGIISGTQVAN